MLPALRKWSPLPLRLLVGLGFISHAVPRLFTASGHLELAAALRQLRVPFPETAAWLASLVEFIGGLAVLEGVLLPLAAGLLLADLVATLVLTHLRDGFAVLPIASAAASGSPLGMPGAHVNLLYAAALLSLLLGGPGPLSVAEAVSRRRARPSPAPPPREPLPREAHA